jgi:hypothetical protein
LAWPVVAAVLTCAAQPEAMTTVRLQVPPEVSRHASARAAGDASSPPPILMLEDLEVGSDEGLTIQVLGPPEKEGAEPPILAITATVGLPQATPQVPIQRMDMVVPLNDEGARLLVGKKEVRLTLRVVDSPGRPAPRFKRAYFKTADKP